MAGRKKSKVVTDPEEIIAEQAVKDAEEAADNLTEEISSAEQSVQETAAESDSAADFISGADPSADAFVEEIENTAPEVSADISDAADNVADTAEEAVSDADSAIDAAEDAGDAVEAAADTAEDAAQDALPDEEEKQDIRKTAAEWADGARKKYEEVKESVKNWVPGPQLPNQLTIARICMIPVFVALLLWMKKPAGNILAMIVFILASLTDAADGYIARRFNYITTFGKFMDPLADKLLVCSALICLVDLGRIESWIVIIIIAREFIISGFRLVAVEKGVVIAANIWGKFKTVFQMLMVILMVANFGGAFNLIAQILKWIALALTLISLVTYIVKNREVLKQN